MAPAKRKRGDRQSLDTSDSRPSPLRPQNNNAGLHEMRDNIRRSSRGGQNSYGGRGGRRNDNWDHSYQINIKNRATPTPGPMSPPQRPLSANQTPAPTPTQTPASVIDLLVVQKASLAPYDFSFITDERLGKWEYSGREAVVTLGIQARQDEDTTDLGSIFQELTRATLNGRLDPDVAGNCVQDILGPDTSDDPTLPFDARNFFLDILSMVCEAEENLKIPLLRIFSVSTGISPVTMRQKLDGKLLQDLGLTRETFGRVGVRQATNLLYRQANYNLLREETEGYAKLVAELFTTSENERPSSEAVEDAFE
ncbi:hypothetical protein similar to nucleic acid binding protein, partial [Blumeria hordei DH14]